MTRNHLLVPLCGAVLMTASYFLFKNSTRQCSIYQKIKEVKSKRFEGSQSDIVKPLLSKYEKDKNLQIIEKIVTLSESIWKCKCLRRDYCDSPYVPMEDTILTISEGKAYWKNDGMPLYSGVTYWDEELPDILSSNGTIAILESGEILASPYVVKHCRLTHEKSVRFAGEFRAKDGGIEFLNRRSGHYQTDRKALEVAIKILELQGIDTKKIQIEWDGNYR